MGKNTEITMIVDTKNIKPHNVDQYVRFKDNRNNPQPSPPENFTSQVNAKFDVRWNAVSENGAEDAIRITQIGRKEKNGGVDLLKGPPQIDGANGALGKVKDQYTEGEESYFVNFKINDTGPEYHVDPKLVMAEH